MQVERINEIPFFDSIQYRIIPHEFHGFYPPLTQFVVIRWADREHEIRLFRFSNTIIGFEIPYPTVEWIYNPPKEIQIGGSKYYRDESGSYRR